MDEIKRMQKHLLLIRRALGWTAECFGDKIGVTRQTINNIEAGRNELTKTQYIAIRSVIDGEIARLTELNKDSKVAKLIYELLDVYVDHPENYDEEEKQQLLSTANMVLPSILAKTATQEEVSEQLFSMSSILVNATCLATALFVPVLLSSKWLSSISKYSKFKE